MVSPLTSSAHLTSSVVLTRGLLSYAQTIGVDVEALLRRVRISPTACEDPDARLPEAKVQRLWAELAAASRDEAFGLHYAQHAEEGAFEVLDYAASYSETLGDAVHRIERFYRLLSDTLAIQLEAAGATTRITRKFGGTDPNDQVAFFAIVVSRLRSIAGREIRAKEVSFEHARRAQPELESFFGGPVRFDRAQSELVLSSADLELPVRAPKPRLAALLDRYAAELLARLPAIDTYASHVLAAITRALRRGAPTLAAIAQEMHSSARTVQRRLARSGLTHTALVDDIRRRLAREYLESPKLSITEIGFLLGYRDESSFRRAFRRWTGKSPRSARA